MLCDLATRMIATPLQLPIGVVTSLIGAVLLDRGVAVAAGPVEQVLTADRLRQVYDMDVKEWMQGLLRRWDDV